MNLIDNIEIKNFKSIRHQKIEGCKRVNVFIGYPNVGKSNILEAIGLFSSLQLNNEHFNFDEICRVKHFSELFFNQDSKEATNITINNSILTELIINKSNGLEVRINKLIDYNRNKDNNNIFSATVNANDFFFKISREPVEANYKDILGAIRKYEFQSNIIFNGDKPYTLAISHGNNLFDILQSNSQLRKEIVKIFNEYRLKLIINRKDRSIEFQKELDDGSAVSIPYHQVADTLRRLIFFKAAIQTNSNSILLFEEPEAHMFPPYISKFTGEVMYDENDNQFFIATHSPFVINDFMENLKKDDYSIYTVGYDNETGETLIRRMTDEELHEIYQYGVDLFLNLENYLPHAQQQ